MEKKHWILCLDHLNEDGRTAGCFFLDIDMPVMDGFQFMEEYISFKTKLGKKKNNIIYMVSLIGRPSDIWKGQIR